MIKQKRKCVDINLGFIYQLSKWEQILKNDKKDKIFKFGNSGDLSIFEYKAYESMFLQNEVFVLLLLQQNKFYKIEYLNNSEVNSTIDNKIKKFIHIIQTYENYPKDIETVNIDNENSKLVLENTNKSKFIDLDNLSELLKNNLYLHNSI